MNYTAIEMLNAALELMTEGQPLRREAVEEVKLHITEVAPDEGLTPSEAAFKVLTRVVDDAMIRVETTMAGEEMIVN